MKKLFSVASLMLVFSVESFATNGDLGGSPYNGSESYPFQISDAADLKAFADYVNDEKEWFNYTAWAVLTADIDLNPGKKVLNADGSLNGDGTDLYKWESQIGSYYAYAGTFKGNGHTIKGLYIDDADANRAGLFNSIEGAVIDGVGLVDSYVRGGQNVGGIVGSVGSSSTVSNCYNEGTVVGKMYVGGVVGKASVLNPSEGDEIKISKCHNTGLVMNVNANASGITGGVVGETLNVPEISDCYNEGTLIGTGITGGVVGYLRSGSTLFNCYNKGKVSGAYVGGGRWLCCCRIGRFLHTRLLQCRPSLC